MARPFTQAQTLGFWRDLALSYLAAQTLPVCKKRVLPSLSSNPHMSLFSAALYVYLFHHRRQAPAREPAVANMTPLSSETRPCASAPCSWGGCASLRCGSFWPPALPACRRQYDVPLIRNATLRVRPLLLGRMRIAPARQLLAAGTAGTARLTFHAFAAKSSAENHIFQPFLPENSLSKPLRRVYNG